MSTDTMKKRPTSTSREVQASPGALGQTSRRLPAPAIGVAVAVLTTLVVYGLFTVYPPAHEPLTGFLATFKQHNAAVWPMQIAWYGCALSIAALALWPMHRSSQLIWLLTAALFAWEGIAYFSVLSSSMSLAGFWAAVFVFEAVLLMVAGILRHDLVIHPRWDLASVLGGVFMGFALLGYPIVGMLGGHSLSTLPLFGLAPCAAVTFGSGLLLWARVPVPLYVLPLLLAWGLCAAPGDLAMGVVADGGMLVAAVTAAVIIIWRNRTSTGQTIVAGLLLALMIAMSGHDNLLIGVAAILVVVTLVQAIRSKTQQVQTGHEL